MHSLNHEVLARLAADENALRPAHRAVRPTRPDRPPSPPVRARVAYVTGRLARRLDREMARRAVV
jgi:hypothetical protein